MQAMEGDNRSTQAMEMEKADTDSVSAFNMKKIYIKK